MALLPLPDSCMATAKTMLAGIAGFVHNAYGIIFELFDI
jgi:hypothetical protein